MSANALVIGYGSAGQRHARELRSRMYNVYTVDVTQFCDYYSVGEAVHDIGDFELCIIATPPDTHLDYIIECLKLTTGVVVCEKPLYEKQDYDKVEFISKLMVERKIFVTYNYRFHEQIEGLHGSGEKGAFEFYSRQYRATKPVWGYLLDHIPHTIDIAFSIARVFAPGNIMYSKTISNDSETLYLELVDGDLVIKITDIILNKPTGEKVSFIATPSKVTMLENDALMFSKMWDCIIESPDDDRLVDFYDGILVNEVIERIVS